MNDIKKELTHEERYTKAVEIIGLNNLVSFIPIKSKEKFDEHYKADKNLNSSTLSGVEGCVSLKDWDRSFGVFGCFINKDIRDLDINHSTSSWVCILKRACKMYYTAKSEGEL